MSPVTSSRVRIRALTAYDAGLGQYGPYNYATCGEIYLLLGGVVLPRTGWTATADSEQATPYAGASLVLDGLNSPPYHSRFTPVIDPLPHALTIDTGSPVTFDTVRYVNFDNGGAVFNGAFAQYEIEAWDGECWIPVGAGTANTANPPPSAATFDLPVARFIADAHQLVFGEEYLYQTYDRLMAGQSVTLRTSCDSRGNGDGITNPAYLLHTRVAALLAARSGSSISAVNGCHSGAHTGQWESTYVLDDIAAAPRLLILDYMFNDVAVGRSVGDAIGSLRRGLEKYRAALRLELSGIVLLTPNASNDTAHGRDAAWLDAVNYGIRQAARDFECGFVDIYKMFQDTRKAAGKWLDEPLTPGVGIHPRENFSDRKSKRIANFLFPK